MEDVVLRNDVEICAHPLIPTLQAGLLLLLRTLISRTHSCHHLCLPSAGIPCLWDKDVWRFQRLINLHLSGKLLELHFSLNQRSMKGNDLKNSQVMQVWIMSEKE